MNLFLDLTVTENILVEVRGHADHAPVKIFINDQMQGDLLVPLRSDITIQLSQTWLDSLHIDGIDIMNHVPVQVNPDHLIVIPGPFYHWWHQVSGQGWLLPAG